jgi:DNA-binding beta-propeller fold protein YncE
MKSTTPLHRRADAAAVVAQIDPPGTDPNPHFVTPRRKGGAMRKMLTTAATLAAGLALAAAAAATSPAPGSPPSDEVWAAGQASGAIYVLTHDGARIDAITASTIQAPNMIQFSPSGRFAYVGDLANGDVNVINRRTHELAAAVTFPSGTDTLQAQPSPDGRTILATRRFGSRTVFKIDADEAHQIWTLAPDSYTLPVGVAPICTEFSPDGSHAFVSFDFAGGLTGGIAELDVATMQLVPSFGSGGALVTAGSVNCTMDETRDRSTIYAVSLGNGGTLYRIDTASGTVTELNGGLGAVSPHWVALSADEHNLYVTSDGSDQLKVVDLSANDVIATLAIDPTSGLDQPSGIAVDGNTVYVSLSNAGKVAIFAEHDWQVRYVDVVPAGPNALPHVTAAPLVPEFR